jgi:hypothetical protein
MEIMLLNISKNIKIRVYKTVILPVVLKGGTQTEGV